MLQQFEQVLMGGKVGFVEFLVMVIDLDLVRVQIKISVLPNHFQQLNF